MRDSLFKSFKQAKWYCIIKNLSKLKDDKYDSKLNEIIILIFHFSLSWVFKYKSWGLIIDWLFIVILLKITILL